MKTKKKKKWTPPNLTTPPPPPPPPPQQQPPWTKMRMPLPSSLKLVKNLKWTSIILGLTNLGVITFGGLLIFSKGYLRSCTRAQLVPFYLVLVAAALRIFAMVRCAVEQKAAAIAILGSSSHPDAVGVSVVHDDGFRRERRLRYKRWICWTRCATVVTVLQLLLAMYLVFVLARSVPKEGTSNECGIGPLSSNEWWRQHLLIIFLILVCFVAILQCFASSDVLRWRSFYDKQDTAWKAHYQEVFDHGIRGALCCLGRVKYLKAMEEDEVHSVAQLLGDLVTYRASGTGHLEFLAGLALLQRHNQSPILDESCVDAPVDKLQEAIAFHPFAEAAYTGPLLDVGRNLILFPCAWLYRQGIFTAWSRNRRPKLEGDNWWRGHAAAFLNYANIPPESLRRGRVNQAKCQATYFIVVLHHIRSVVIAVRGTETPEDLITDGLCRETSLTVEDLDAFINGVHIDPTMRQQVLSSFPHYGHSGVVGAARELYNQIEGSNSEGENGIATSGSGGFLSSLLGVGCECEGYAVRVVGHSLGGAIAAMLGIRLRGRFPNLLVCAYGPLPCVDWVIAEACSEFITSIVHDSEFSSYLSINSILRLRAAALTTMSQGSTTDSAVISKLAHLFLYLSKIQIGDVMRPLQAAVVGVDATKSHTNNYSYGSQSRNSRGTRNSRGSIKLNEYSVLHGSESSSDFLFEGFPDLFAIDGNSVEDPVSEFLEGVPSSESTSADDPPEVFLPGLVLHLIRRHRGINLPMWKGWRVHGAEPPYKAIIANRENFKDILISPYMFLDHLPWRCHYALAQVLKSRNSEINQHGSQIV